MPEKRADLLTTTEAARLVGVGASTIKRWADQGVLPHVKTAGGHRRYRRAAVLALAVAGDSARDAAGPAASAVESDRSPAAALVDALLAGPQHRVQAMLLEGRARHARWADAADELALALTELGARYCAGTISIADEHQASERLARALALLGDALPVAASAPRCLLASADGDDHTLGLALVELVLREAGWSVWWCGRRTPTAEIVGAVVRREVQMVALSASAASTDRRRLRAQADAIGAACAAAKISLVLGGTGAWPTAPRHAIRVSGFGDLAVQIAPRPARRRGF